MLVVAATVVGYFMGWIRTDATSAADSRYAAKHQTEFETTTVQGLTKAEARMDQTDRERESRAIINNKNLTDQGEALRALIDAAVRRLEQRADAITVDLNELRRTQDNQSLRICVLSGLKVSQCK